ncbi:MAG: hypothetical protein AAFX99_35480, partial [Myxococcota bacterium]
MFKQRALIILYCVVLGLAWAGCGDSSSSDGSGGELLGNGGEDQTTDSTSNGSVDTTGGETSPTGGGDTTTTPGCMYPENTGLIAKGKVMPRLWWDDAQLPDGSSATFDLQAFHCDPAYDAYSVVIVVVSAGWCPACPDYIRYVGGQAEQLEAAGALLLFVETELADGTPATGPDADAHITELIDAGKGIRVGDGTTQPEARTVYRAPLIGGFPAGFVVRRSDMLIIADQSESQYYLPFEEIAREPDRGIPPVD